jgi:hypothetical protein
MANLPIRLVLLIVNRFLDEYDRPRKGYSGKKMLRTPVNEVPRKMREYDY